MTYLITWIKKHKIISIILLLLFFILPLLFVHLLFKWNSANPLIEAEWSAGDLLGYIAGFETLLGTAMLSFLALWQNQQINNNNDFTNQANIKRPFFVIDNVTYKEGTAEVNVDFSENRYKHYSENPTTLYIYLKNVGDGIANECSYEPYGFGHVPDDSKPSDCISVNSLYRIPCHLVSEDGFLVIKTISILYRNMIGFRYKQVIIVTADKTPIQTGEECIDVGDHIEYYPLYEKEEYNTYINLISSQIPIGLK